MTEVSEKKIIEKVLGGDANAFEELVLKYEKRSITLRCAWWGTATMPSI